MWESKPHKILLVALFSVSLLTSCVSQNKGYQGVSTIIGGQIGGQAAGLPGAIFGAGLALSFVKMRNNNKEVKIAFQKAMEYNSRGVSRSWSNPYDQTNGSFTPVNAFQLNNGTYCREVIETYQVNYRIHQNTVVACRVSKLNWKVRKVL
jgi:surface antigen